MTLTKSLKVEIKRTSWPNNRPPRKLARLAGTQNINITAFLLMIGDCTVPTHAARHSINALWAWVRYFGAFSPDADFRLSHDFAELDPHQKTILSDDFGMGMSLHLIFNALGLQSFCDGKYFIDRMSTRVRFKAAAKNAKNGARKSPDFVGWDRFGKFHVIECKGTQSGAAYSNRQMNLGITQKCAIRFAQPNRGQSLVTGFEIAQAQDASESRIVIQDPEPEDPPLDINEDEAGLAVETLARAKIAKSFMLAGASNLSRIVAAPFGDDPANLPDSQLSMSERERASRLRLAGQDDLLGLSASDGFLGREATFDLPFRIQTKSGTFTKVFVRSEVAEDLVKFWAELLRNDNPFDDVLGSEQEGMAKGKIETSSHASGGELQDGKLFRSRIEFLK